MREHMLKEERRLFPLAMAVLAKADWQLIDEGVDAIDDPLFGEMIAEEYQRLYQLIVDHSSTARKSG